MANKLRLFVIFAVISLALGQKYLPKEGPIPFCNLYTTNLANSGMTEFWKVDANGWSTLFSAYPLKPQTITKITFETVVGGGGMIGCGVLPSDLNILRRKYPGQFPKSIGFQPGEGYKYMFGDAVDYTSSSAVGDKITMKIDLRTYKNTVSYARNGLDLGVAFAGLNIWKSDIYIMFGIHDINSRSRIINYEVIE